MQTNIPGGTVSFSLALAGGRESGKEGARVNNERNTSTRANETTCHLTPGIISLPSSSSFTDYSFPTLTFMLPLSLDYPNTRVHIIYEKKGWNDKEGKRNRHTGTRCGKRREGAWEGTRGEKRKGILGVEETKQGDFREGMRKGNQRRGKR